MSGSSHSERYALFDTAASGDRVVAVGAGGTHTLSELRADVERLAARLPEARGDAVLIACGDRYAFAVALLAAWAKELTVALPPSHHAPVLSALARDASIGCAVHDGELSEPDAAKPIFDLREALHANAARTSLARWGALDGAAHAVTLYTSGTTGEQQAVPKTAKQLLGEVEVLAQCFGGDTHRVLCTLPPRHIYGLLFGLLLPLRAGGLFVRETPLHTDAVLALAAKHEVDTLVAVPAHLQGVPTAGPIACLKQVFSSGAPLRAETFDALRAAQLTVIEVLGSTETGGIGYRKGPRDAYLPFPGVAVAAAEDGRLMLSSPRLAPELSQPHACEDIVELLPSGEFVHVGRADDVVKVGGTRVSLSAIERAVRGLPGVRDAALVAREVPGARAQEILLAVAGEGWDAARMRAALREHVAPIALPRRYRFVSELPREATGKLRRESMLALFAARRDDDAEGDAVPTALERGASTRERDAQGERVRIALRVPEALLYFQGHFEGWPVLPGVVQLGMIAVGEALAAWPDLGALRRVRRLKLKRPIAPGTALALELTRPLAVAGDEHARVDFVLTLVDGGELCSSGSLAFGAQRAELAS